MSAQTATAAPNPPVINAAPAADGASERAVLAHLLDAHPRRLTFTQLARELGGQCDPRAVRCAIRNLAAASLLVAGHELAVSQAIAQLDQLIL